jgi:hypothetical protein
MRTFAHAISRPAASTLLGLFGCAGCDPALRSAATRGPERTNATDAADSEAGSSGGPRGDTSDPLDDRPTNGFLGGFFPVGVFGQPAWAMHGWASIGCNTMLVIPREENAARWDEEAQRLGLAVIRRPVGDPSADVDRDDLLAWALPDEPDVEANNSPCGGNCVELSESLSASWRAVDPKRKIFVNVAGPNVLLSDACDYCNGPGDEPPAADCYPDNDQCYPRIFETADWISEDIYPVTGWLPSETLREDITVVGRTLDRLRAWTDKPLFAIIEVSDQRLGFDGTGSRGPTPDEYRAELWHAIIHGARGVFYFPQAFNPFDFEAVSPGVLDEMILQHDRLDDLGPILQTDIDPTAIGVVAEPPLEATWRQTERNTWVFVLNTTNAAGTGRVRIDAPDGDVEVHGESRTATLSGGALVDDFSAYQLHVYTIPRT